MWIGHSQQSQIDQIAQKAKLSQLYLRPNIVLLHAGTNDLNLSPPIDPDHAPERLGALIDQLVADGPDAVILVAQIINAANAQTESLIQKYNDAIPGVVAQRAKNHKVAVVECVAYKLPTLPTAYTQRTLATEKWRISGYKPLRMLPTRAGSKHLRAPSQILVPKVVIRTATVLRHHTGCPLLATIRSLPEWATTAT